MLSFSRLILICFAGPQTKHKILPRAHNLAPVIWDLIKSGPKIFTQLSGTILHKEKDTFVFFIYVTFWLVGEKKINIKLNVIGTKKVMY